MKVFTKNDNGFVCQNCKKMVEPLKVSSRNHCPYCLCSLHVDINPGDRQNNCKGLLIPIQIELNPKKGKVIVFKCNKCGKTVKNKCAPDDNERAILDIMRKGWQKHQKYFDILIFVFQFVVKKNKMV